jgi:carboxyl-terminal processing protease
MNRSPLVVWLGSFCFLAIAWTVAPLLADDDYRNDEPRPPRPTQDISEEEYYELLRLLADTLDQVERNYVKEVTRRELVEAAIQGVIGKLDQYSNYIPPEDVERFRGGIENEFGGIGIQVAIENGELTITSPIVGTPAYKAGLKSGDVITKIEGEGTKGITLDGAVKKLKGAVGTSVTFTVRHKHDGKEETINVKREIVRVDSVLGDLRNEDDSWHWFLDDEKKIGYIRITSFSRHTAEDLRTAMRQLNDEGLRGLIIDLRFNPGGLLTSAIDICDMFISEGVIVSTKGRNTPENPRYATKAGTYEDFPMAVLVNRYSASASEIMSACLQDHKRAVIIGERTWGKGSVQNIINLEEGKSALKLTTAAYHRPSGKNIHRFDGATDEDDWGVRPNDGFDIRMTDDEMSRAIDYRRLKDVVREVQGEGDVPDFQDRHLEKAVEYLLAKLGDSPAVDDPRTAKPSPPVPVTEAN